MDKIEFKNRPNIGHNINGRMVWESRSPALVAVIICRYEDIDYVLLGQRGTGSADYQGLWNVPCGYLDWDENGFEGICREVYEETGLYIPDYLDNNVITDEWLYEPFFVNTEVTENRQNVALSYGLYFETWAGLPKLTTEHSEHNEVAEARWVDVSKIDEYEFAFCHDRRIKHFLEHLKIDDLPF